MPLSVNQNKANKILREEIKAAEALKKPQTALAKAISDVVGGSHLTYRYILVNGLLAKATNSSVNPLTLQAGSDLDGAFDARSLCHKVLVPTERELLENRLGGSNEPFLNKPARFKELSTDNAVRRGRDQDSLKLTIKILRSLRTAEEARAALRDALFFILQRPGDDYSVILPDLGAGEEAIKVMEFMACLVSESIEGETCALATAGAYSALKGIHPAKLEIKVHPVNQPGASSNEVCDIDVYASKRLLYTAEVKDKLFAAQDVGHAVRKVRESGHASLLFVEGPRAALTDSRHSTTIQEAAEHGVFLSFTGVLDFIATSVNLVGPALNPEEIFSDVQKFAREARVKDETLKHLERCLKRI